MHDDETKHDAIRIRLAAMHEHIMGAVIRWASRRLARRGYSAERYLARG